MRYLLVLFAACGGGSGSPDAAVDAPPDVWIDAPEAPPGVYRFVLDKEKIPKNTPEARMFGLDLDGDAVVDNQLGMVMGTLAGMGFDAQGATDASIDRGKVIQLAELHADSLVAGPGTFTLFTGANPMPSACFGASDVTCRHHLTGMSSFALAPTSAHDTPLAGTMASVVVAGPGHVQLALIAFGTDAVPLNLVGARVKLTNPGGTMLGDGVIAGGIPQSEIDGKIHPAIRDSANAAIMRDCTALSSPPACGCAPASTGKTMKDLFDTTPANCMVSTDEVKNSTLFQSLLAPDVMLEGQQCLSVGIGFTAVHASFVP